MTQVVKLLGQPEDHLLANGLYTKKYFVRVNGSNGPAWRLKVEQSFSFE